MQKAVVAWSITLSGCAEDAEEPGMYVSIFDMYNENCSFSTSGGPTSCRLCGDLGLDESQSLRAVLVDVLLVGVGVVAGAAVWVSCVAVRLDDACIGG